MTNIGDKYVVANVIDMHRDGYLDFTTAPKCKDLSGRTGTVLVKGTRSCRMRIDNVHDLGDIMLWISYRRLAFRTNLDDYAALGIFSYDPGKNTAAGKISVMPLRMARSCRSRKLSNDNQDKLFPLS